MVPWAGASRGPRCRRWSCGGPSGKRRVLPRRQRSPPLRAARGSHAAMCPCGGGGPRGGSRGVAAWGRPAGRLAPRPAAELPAGAGEVCRRPSPRRLLRPRSHPSLRLLLLVTSWAPAQINFLGIFKTAAAGPLCAVAAALGRTGRAVGRSRFHHWDRLVAEAGTLGFLALHVFLTHLRGRGAGRRKASWDPAPAPAVPVCPALFPFGAPQSPAGRLWTSP